MFVRTVFIFNFVPIFDCALSRFWRIKMGEVTRE